MTLSELYLLIGLPDGVIAQLNEYEENRTCEIPPEIKAKLFCRQTWAGGVEELKAFLGEDSYSMKILWEQLNLVCTYSYEEYVKRGISMEIFKDTFGFITRFVTGTKDADNKYRYDWAWWFQRQVTLQEFRIGSLEYEFVEEKNHRTIEVHRKPTEGERKTSKELIVSIADSLGMTLMNPDIPNEELFGVYEE